MKPVTIILFTHLSLELTAADRIGIDHKDLPGASLCGRFRIQEACSLDQDTSLHPSLRPDVLVSLLEEWSGFHEEILGGGLDSWLAWMAPDHGMLFLTSLWLVSCSSNPSQEFTESCFYVKMWKGGWCPNGPWVPHGDTVFISCCSSIYLRSNVAWQLDEYQ